MTCHEIEQLWDEYRDGTLESQHRGRFAAHLAQCEQCARRYERESQWLGALRESAAVGEQDSPAFVEAVLDRWQKPVRSLAVLRWRVTAMAAMVALGAMLSLVLLISQTDEPARITLAPGTPESPREIAAANGAVDPVSVLMLDMTRHLDQQPSQIRETIDQTASANLRAIVDLFAAMEQPDVPRRSRDQPRS